MALGEVGRGARPDQLGRAPVVAGSGRVIDGLLEALMLRVPGAGAAVELGLDFRLPATELRGQRLLEERVVAIGAVGVIQRLQRKLRPGQLAQDPAGSRPLENVVADLAGEVLEDRGPHQESEAGDRNAREELVPHVVGHEAVVAAEPGRIDGRAVPILQRESRQVERRRPALRPLVERLDLVGV